MFSDTLLETISGTTLLFTSTRNLSVKISIILLVLMLPSMLLATMFPPFFLFTSLQNKFMCLFLNFSCIDKISSLYLFDLHVFNADLNKALLVTIFSYVCCDLSRPPTTHLIYDFLYSL